MSDSRFKDNVDEIPEALSVYKPADKVRNYALLCGAETWFDVWMILVDRYLLKATGFSSSDLPDIDYWSLFDAGCTPKQGASECIDYDDLDWPNPYRDA